MIEEISNAKAASDIALDLSNFAFVMDELREKILNSTADNRICALVSLLTEEAKRLSSYMDLLDAAIVDEQMKAAAA